MVATEARLQVVRSSYIEQELPKYTIFSFGFSAYLNDTTPVEESKAEEIMTTCSASWALNPSNSISRKREQDQSLSSPWIPSTTCPHGQVRNNLYMLRKTNSFIVKAAKLPAGVELPKAEPKFKPSFAGFTRTAETWNSRACMIGIIGTFIAELILNKGILELIGVEVGKGLNIPL